VHTPPPCHAYWLRAEHLIRAGVGFLVLREARARFDRPWAWNSSCLYFFPFFFHREAVGPLAMVGQYDLFTPRFLFQGELHGRGGAGVTRHGSQFFLGWSFACKKKAALHDPRAALAGPPSFETLGDREFPLTVPGAVFPRTPCFFFRNSWDFVYDFLPTVLGPVALLPKPETVGCGMRTGVPQAPIFCCPFRTFRPASPHPPRVCIPPPFLPAPRTGVV